MIHKWASMHKFHTRVSDFNVCVKSGGNREASGEEGGGGYCAQSMDLGVPLNIPRCHKHINRCGNIKQP